MENGKYNTENGAGVEIVAPNPARAADLFRFASQAADATRSRA